MESHLQEVVPTDKVNRIKELLDANNDIYNKLHHYKDALNNMHNSSTISYNDIIDFADNITLTLSAPRLYRDGLPLIASHAPCPQLYEMRMGKLASFNNSSAVKQIQDMGKKTYENITIESKITIVNERQLSSNNSTNKRKRDDTDASELIEDERPVRRLREEETKAKSDTKIETNLINGTSNTTILASTTTTIMDISKAEVKTSESNEITNKTEAPIPVLAPKRVINISFGLSDSESDDDD